MTSQVVTFRVGHGVGLGLSGGGYSTEYTEGIYIAYRSNVASN
jgi:hypothetical protein